jgi:hypothetical protein
VEFLRQTTDYGPGRHHLAVDHSKQLYRAHAQPRTEHEYMRGLRARQVELQQVTIGSQRKNFRSPGDDHREPGLVDLIEPQRRDGERSLVTVTRGSDADCCVVSKIGGLQRIGDLVGQVVMVTVPNWN